jgi:hypothetical protein
LALRSQSTPPGRNASNRRSSIFSLRFSSMFLGGKIEVLQETATRLNRVQLDRLPTAATQEVY